MAQAASGVANAAPGAADAAPEVAEAAQILCNWSVAVEGRLEECLDSDGAVAPERSAGQASDEAWKKRLALLREYVEANGRYPLQEEVVCGVNLGHWVHRQRAAKKDSRAGKMTPERAAALESLPGWEWAPTVFAEGVWRKRFALLREHVEATGRYPPRRKAYRGFNLGEWVQRQRQAKKDARVGKMTPERAAALESLPGWSWAPDEHTGDAWSEYLALLREYVEVTGIYPPQHGQKGVFRGFNLGEWVHRQRQAKKSSSVSKMTPERAAVLEGLPGWNWAPIDDAWSEHLALLRKYVEATGTYPPLGPKGVFRGVNLGQWVRRQRLAAAKDKKAGKMTPERAAALESLPGWRW
jgi:hypothetical protein